MTFIGTYWTFLFNYNLGVPKTMILQVFYQKTRKETPLICKSSYVYYIYTLFCQLIINKSKREHNHFEENRSSTTSQQWNKHTTWKINIVHLQITHEKNGKWSEPSTSMRFHGTQPLIFREGNPTQPWGNSLPCLHQSIRPMEPIGFNAYEQHLAGRSDSSRSRQVIPTICKAHGDPNNVGKEWLIN